MNVGLGNGTELVRVFMAGNSGLFAYVDAIR